MVTCFYPYWTTTAKNPIDTYHGKTFFTVLWSRNGLGTKPYFSLGTYVRR